MSRVPIVVVIVVLLAANCVVFGNIAALLYTASSEAAGRIAATRVPEATALPQATTPPPPTAVPTQTATPSSTPTSGPSSTPTATATRSLSSYPTYAPVGTETPMKYPFVYTVKAGDTLSALADRFRIPRTKLMEANGLTDSNLIRIGQVLYVPDPNQ